MVWSYRERSVEFRVVGPTLIQVVRGVKRGAARDYDHTCGLDVLQEVAWFLQEATAGTTTGELYEAFPDFPRTQISVALAFLKETDVATVIRRRVHPATPCTFEDAMIEFYWLQHKATLCGT